MKTLYVLTKTENLSVEDLFLIRGGAGVAVSSISSAQSMICDNSGCKGSACNSGACISSGCKSKACKDGVCNSNACSSSACNSRSCSNESEKE
ncbi:MAG: hypothetical protein LBV69_02795 [Bacteroidales bacterium]|jgi:hypothetical protein|nr:hypothetical protein [Bacteroidales bacterium]